MTESITCTFLAATLCASQVSLPSACMSSLPGTNPSPRGAPAPSWNSHRSLSLRPNATRNFFYFSTFLGASKPHGRLSAGAIGGHRASLRCHPNARYWAWRRCCSVGASGPVQGETVMPGQQPQGSQERQLHDHSVQRRWHIGCQGSAGRRRAAAQPIVVVGHSNATLVVGGASSL